jgi:glycosyltransferase involved in cell wall biosynthesis
VIVSRLAEQYKNVELAVDLAARLGPRGIVSDVSIIGSGPRASALETYARESGGERFVTFHGHLPDDEVRDIVAEAHIGLFPSTYSTPLTGYEGFGLTIHELGTAGMPVLAGAVAGALDAIEPPWTIALDPDDHTAWEATITDLWQDESTRYQLAQEAYNWATARTFTGHEDIVDALWDGVDAPV